MKVTREPSDRSKDWSGVYSAECKNCGAAFQADFAELVARGIQTQTVHAATRTLVVATASRCTFCNDHLTSFSFRPTAYSPAMGPTKDAEMLVDIAKTQGIYHAIAFLYDSQSCDAATVKRLLPMLEVKTTPSTPVKY